MDFLNDKTRTIVIHFALVALYMLPAAAASLPHLNSFFHHTPAITIER